MRRMAAFLAAGVLVLACGGLAKGATRDRWLHIRVDEHGESGERVRVNIPLTLVESIAPLLDDIDLGEGGRLRVNDKDLDAAELRKFLEAVKKSPDAEYITVESLDSHVVVSKHGDTLHIVAHEDGEDQKAEIRMPIAVVDALVSAPDGRLNLSAAVKALGERGTGDLITVTDRESHVRIWIDETNTSK